MAGSKVMVGIALVDALHGHDNWFKCVGCRIFPAAGLLVEGDDEQLSELTVRG